MTVAVRQGSITDRSPTRGSPVNVAKEYDSTDAEAFDEPTPVLAPDLFIRFTNTHEGSGCAAKPPR